MTSLFNNIFQQKVNPSPLMTMSREDFIRSYRPATWEERMAEQKIRNNVRMAVYKVQTAVYKTVRHFDQHGFHLTRSTR